MKRYNNEQLEYLNDRYEALNAEAVSGGCHDDDNENFIFSNVTTALLAKAAKGQIDLEYLLRRTLADRGYNTDGVWVGFKEAAKPLKPAATYLAYRAAKYEKKYNRKYAK